MSSIIVPVVLESSKRILISDSTNNFRYKLHPSVRDVTEVEFCWWSIPLTNYNITSSNNKISFNVE